MLREVTWPASETCRLSTTGEERRSEFDASVARHMNDLLCDLDNASASLARLTKCVSTAVCETFPVKRPTPLRKREVSQRTKLLFEERRRNFNRLNEQDRRESTRATNYDDRATAKRMGEVPWRKVPATDSRR